MRVFSHGTKYSFDFHKINTESQSQDVTLADQITEWFRRGNRDLPWRQTSDPYKIWVSEIMLQQTGVSTVVPYFLRFIERFPTVTVLASATEDEVLHLWQGLGYYRRAKNLRAGAILIQEKWNGVFPRTREELLEVPGIGAYSSGAILSIAFREKAAALDGNLIRVYSRYFAIEDPVDQGATLKKLWQIAEDHVPENPEDRREFTEGMMELGATVCTPRNPLCGACPLQQKCQGFRKGIVATLPTKSKIQKREKHQEIIFLFSKDEKVALLPRGTDPKFKDFFRLPYLANPKAKELKNYQLLGRHKYSVTHRDFEVLICRGSGKPPKDSIWLDLKEIDSTFLAAIDRKILKQISEYSPKASKSSLGLRRRVRESVPPLSF